MQNNFVDVKSKVSQDEFRRGRELGHGSDASVGVAIAGHQLQSDRELPALQGQLLAKALVFGEDSRSGRRNSLGRHHGPSDRLEGSGDEECTD